MRATMRHRLVAATAAALLASTLAACNNDPKPEATTLEPAPTGSAAPSATTQAASSTPAQSGDCALPEGDQAIPKTAPPVDEWVEVNTVGVPTSNTYGPMKREGDLFSCYAHSPTGALFASVYVLAAAGRVPGFADEWVEDGPVHDQYKQAEEQGVEAGFGGNTLTLRGYRITSATAEKVDVELALEVGTPEGRTLVSSHQAMKWTESGWKMDTSTPPASPSPLPENMPGFTAWSTNA